MPQPSEPLPKAGRQLVFRTVLDTTGYDDNIHSAIPITRAAAEELSSVPRTGTISSAQALKGAAGRSAQDVMSAIGSRRGTADRVLTWYVLCSASETPAGGEYVCTCF